MEDLASKNVTHARGCAPQQYENTACSGDRTGETCQNTADEKVANSCGLFTHSFDGTCAGTGTKLACMILLFHAETSAVPVH